MISRTFAVGAALLFAQTGVATCQVVWSDEFNGDRIDPLVWTFDVGGHGFGNGQLEYNTARSENAYLQDGSLVIEARRENYRGNAFTSARMLTQGRFAFRYGTLQARIKMPDTADGIWPAFWMLGNNFPAIQWPESGEIDIVEVGSKRGIAEGKQRRKINCALHFADADRLKAIRDAWYDADVNLNDDYHIYSVEWTPDRMAFLLDGHEFGSWDIRGDEFREFHQPFFPILNVAVGSWASSYTAVDSPQRVTAPLPAKMHVDWIRLKRNEHTEIFLGADNEQSGSFGVFTETTPTRSSLEFTESYDSEFAFSDSAAVYLWNNMTPLETGAQPSEGSDSWAFQVASGDWYGMGVFVPHFRNMRNYSDGMLHFDIKTDSPEVMRVGIKSSRGGEFFLPLGDPSAEFGFTRDGTWQTVSIPLNRFANVDFATVHQFLMIAGDPPDKDMVLEIDNVWWQPSVDRPTPPAGTFGVFTETTEHRSAGEFQTGQDGDFFVWENTLVEAESQPREGNEAKRLESSGGQAWFGAAFTPNIKHDLSAYAGEDGRLCFSLRTRSTTTFMVGLKSGTVDGIGQGWVRFEAGNDPHGFARDGEWHSVEIPLAEIAKEVNLSEVSQLFLIVGFDGPISAIEIDDIYYSSE